jgi:hypothetical protein
MASLEFLNGPLEGQEFDLPEQGIVIIGRDADATLQIDDERISRRHCAVEVTPKGCYLCDIASKNGTFLNDNPITRERLESGDRIRLAHLEIIARVDKPRRKRAVSHAETADLGAGVADDSHCDICGQHITLEMIRQSTAQRVLDWLLCPQCLQRMEAFKLQGIMGVEALKRLMQSARRTRPSADTPALRSEDPANRTASDAAVYRPRGRRKRFT